MNFAMRIMNKKYRLLILVGSLILLIIIEVVLRLVWGFGKMPLYAASDEVNPHKKNILGLGDSVIYGGVQTDQDSLATSLFSAETGMQMLNISAGS